jgi:hypothetical protein
MAELLDHDHQCQPKRQRIVSYKKSREQGKGGASFDYYACI